MATTRLPGRQVAGGGAMTAMSTQAQDHVDRNYGAFKTMLPDLIRTNPGDWALLRNEELEAVFDTAKDAHTAGKKLFPDRAFSVQEIRVRVVDLGRFSHALP